MSEQLLDVSKLEYLGSRDGVPVYRAPWRVLPFHLAKASHACQRCKLSGKRIAEIPRSRVAGLRRAGDVGWTKVVLCLGCITLARASGYEVLDG